MRDTQRQRVYDAERKVPASPIGTGSMNEIVAFVEKVVGSAWWQRRSRVRTVICKDGRGRVNACAYGNTIKIPRWGRSKMVVLHELAHVLNDSGGAPHGREFAAAYLALVDRFGEPEAGKQLRAAYAEKRVRWRGAKLETHAIAKPTCVQCGREASTVWRVRGGGYNWRFCTKRCGDRWFAEHLHRVEAAAAVRG